MILHELKETALTDKRISSVYFGDVLRTNEANKSYPCLNIDIENAITDANDLRTNFLIYVIDRTKSDRSDELEVQNDCIKILNNYLQNLLSDGFAVIFPVTINTFSHKFVDQCAGAFCNVELIDNDCIL